MMSTNLGTKRALVIRARLAGARRDACTNLQCYYRPWKTILVRMVAEGGESFYFCGDHRATLPALHHLIVRHA